MAGYGFIPCECKEIAGKPIDLSSIGCGSDIKKAIRGWRMAAQYNEK